MTSLKVWSENTWCVLGSRWDLNLQDVNQLIWTVLNQAQEQNQFHVGVWDVSRVLEKDPGKLCNLSCLYNKSWNVFRTSQDSNHGNRRPEGHWGHRGVSWHPWRGSRSEVCLDFDQLMMTSQTVTDLTVTHQVSMETSINQTWTVVSTAQQDTVLSK